MAVIDEIVPDVGARLRAWGLTELDAWEAETPRGIGRRVLDETGDSDAAMLATRAVAKLLWRHRWGHDRSAITEPDDPRLDGWYHTIELAPGLVTRGLFDHRPVVDCYGLPDSLEGMSALDVGTSDGFWAFELERRGATRIAAIDIARLGDADVMPHRSERMLREDLDDRTPIDRFATARASLGSAVEHNQLSVYDLSPERLGSFDFLFCGSLLLHLTDPLRALVAMRSVTRQRAVIETAGMPDIAGCEHLPLVQFGVRDHEDHPGLMAEYWRVTDRALLDLAAYAGFVDVEIREPFWMPAPGVSASYGGVFARAFGARVEEGAVMGRPAAGTPSGPARQPSALERLRRLARHPRYAAWNAWKATLDDREW